MSVGVCFSRGLIRRRCYLPFQWTPIVFVLSSLSHEVAAEIIGGPVIEVEDLVLNLAHQITCPEALYAFICLYCCNALQVPKGLFFPCKYLYWSTKPQISVAKALLVGGVVRTPLVKFVRFWWPTHSLNYSFADWTTIHFAQDYKKRRAESQWERREPWTGLGVSQEDGHRSLFGQLNKWYAIECACQGLPSKYRTHQKTGRPGTNLAEVNVSPGKKFYQTSMSQSSVSAGPHLSEGSASTNCAAITIKSISCDSHKFPSNRCLLWHNGANTMFIWCLMYKGTCFEKKQLLLSCCIPSSRASSVRW